MGRIPKVLLSVVGSIIAMLLSITYFHVVQFGQIRYSEFREASRSGALAESFFEPSRAPNATGIRDLSGDGSVGREEPRDGCFSLNSQDWLEGERIPNLHSSEFMSEDFVMRSIVGLPTLLSDAPATAGLLKQTLCHEDSRFLSLDLPKNGHDSIPSSANEGNGTSSSIHFWSLRLIYLATHIHQHLPALEEAKARLEQSSQCQPERDRRGIGVFDYECPSSKFLVVSMGRLGLGAVMRLGVVNSLIAGMASNRTVLVVNDAPVGPKFLREPWLLASCPRRDMQCFYMPMSPCVVTHNEIRNATTLQRGQARALFKTGKLPDHLEDERVVLLDVMLRPQRTPQAFRDNTVRIIHEHILNPLRRGPHQHLLPLLTKAAGNILQEEQLQDGSYYYFGHNSKHNHALVFYAMRPNFEYTTYLHKIMHDIIPADLNPDSTLGLPIRGSDKCELESECMPFDRYMDLTNHTWRKYQTEIQKSTRPENEKPSIESLEAARPSVIITSEAMEIHNALHRYKNRDISLDIGSPFRLVHNKYDIHQDTGNPGRINANISADDVMLASVSSLKAQMNARYTIGNCCSNFHLLLFDFLRDGCGAARDQVAQCMQDHEDPAFRLCCQWSKNDECKSKRAATK